MTGYQLDGTKLEDNSHILNLGCLNRWNGPINTGEQKTHKRGAKVKCLLWEACLAQEMRSFSRQNGNDRVEAFEKQTAVQGFGFPFQRLDITLWWLKHRDVFIPPRDTEKHAEPRDPRRAT